MSEFGPARTTEIAELSGTAAAFMTLVNELGGAIALKLIESRLLADNDLDWAMADMKARSKILADSAPDDEGLTAFVHSVKDLGTGGIKTAENTADIADALSRQLDGIDGYMRARDMINPEVDRRLDDLADQLHERFGQEQV